MTKNLFKFMCDEYIENYNKYIECDNAIRGCFWWNDCKINCKSCNYIDREECPFIRECRNTRTRYREQMEIIEDIMNDYFKYLNNEYRKAHPNTGVVPTLFYHWALDLLGFIDKDGNIKVDELLKHASNGLVD